MKYVLFAILLLIFLRIDMFIGVVERAWNKVPRPQGTEVVVEPIETPPVSTFSVAGLQEDQISQFRLLMTEFTYKPDKLTRELLINYIKSNPSVLEIKDTILFSELEKWVPLIQEDNPEVLLTLNDLMGLFKGASLQVLFQFYSNFLERNTEFFFHYFPIAKDPNCIVAKYAWNHENSLNEERLLLRKNQIEGLAGKIEAGKTDFASNCLLVIRVESSKLPQPSENP